MLFLFTVSFVRSFVRLFVIYLFLLLEIDSDDVELDRYYVEFCRY